MPRKRRRLAVALALAGVLLLLLLLMPVCILAFWPRATSAGATVPTVPTVPASTARPHIRDDIPPPPSTVEQKDKGMEYRDIPNPLPPEPAHKPGENIPDRP